MNFQSFWCLFCGAIVALISWTASAQNTNELLVHTLSATNADAAWTEFSKLAHAPETPKSWAAGTVDLAEKRAFFKPYISAYTDRAHDFYTRFPTNSNQLFARVEEFNEVKILAEMGDPSQSARFQSIGKELLKEHGLNNQNHFVAALLLAEAAPDPAKRAQLTDIVNAADAPDNVKMAAQETLHKLAMLGTTPTIKYTAVDGREVDLAALKGKVVLVDFWATWCPPCLQAMPSVKKAYSDFHDKGFEIVGISLDEDKNHLVSFIKDKGMAWPQFYDGLHWENKFALQYAVHAIPAAWLIDKQGKIRDMEAVGQLESEIPKLLAE